MQKILSILLLISLIAGAQAQSVQILEDSIKWLPSSSSVQIFGGTYADVLEFQGAVFHDDNPQIPVYTARIPLNGPSDITLNLLSFEESSVAVPELKSGKNLSEDFEITYMVSSERGSYFARIHIVPIRKKSNSYTKLDRFSLEITSSPRLRLSQRSSWKANSILRNSGIFKLALSETGIYKIDYEQLRKIGINPDQVNPRNIRIFANNGGMLPEENSAERIDDLEELPIWISGEEDGVFNTNDFILFYAEGPNKWSWSPDSSRMTQKTNIYDTRSHVFITATQGTGKRVQMAESPVSVEYSTSYFSDFFRLEQDLVNIGHISPYTSGAGKQWYGDFLRNQRERLYNNIFNFPNREPGQPIYLETVFAGRSNESSRFFIDVNGSPVGSTIISGTRTGNSEFPYARIGRINQEVSAEGDNIQINLRYPEVTGSASEGWLDFIEINARRQITYTDKPLIFRDLKSIDKNGVEYRVSSANQSNSVWKVDNIFETKEVPSNLNGTNLDFRSTGTGFEEFVVFRPSQVSLVPEIIGEVIPQNLHALDGIDLLIVYHPAFESEAQRLASFRANHNGLSVGLAPTDQIFNEFSGGSHDPVAIRDFARMIYERNSQFKHLLLFGDATFDYRNIYQIEGDRSFVPCWQTEQSLDPINSFPSDDFFALLDPDEGGTLRGAIDIAVGRLPVNNIIQARAVVDKLIHYENNPESQGDWRLRLTFVADDEDNNKHINDADEIATFVEETYPVFNINKIYFDAFPQIITPGGERFPAAKEAINKAMFKGMLVMNYLGHGGPTGWAQERVLEISDINSWTNYDALTLMVTATCTLAPYDNPFQTSAGELAILNPRGGAIGLYTTTRAVYAHSNKRLTFSVFREIFERQSNEKRPIGEILRLAKNATSEDTLQNNARKFTLLGDPATLLPLTDYSVRTIKINGKEISPGEPDTLKALNKYTIEGVVTNDNGEIQEWFNGIIAVNIYDKETNLSTFGQNSGSIIRSFKLRRNVIFTGQASVQNGRFSISFIVPKSIDYLVGPGKISYYAWQPNNIDASGYNTDVLVGGAGDGSAISSNGPEVTLFMNDENFAFGGITNANPILLAKIEAENGINISGASIGHDLSAVIDNDDKNSLILNDFFQGEIDDFTKGQVRYPLSNLEPGLHNIKVKAFDVAHNPAEAFIEFTVVKDGNLEIRNLYNYPNPFNRRTNIQFEHNVPGVPMDVQVQIFSISGNMVKSIERSLVPQGYMIRDIDWDGMDEYGQKLANGVYLYKVKIATTDLNGNPNKLESGFQKMVILN